MPNSGVLPIRAAAVYSCTPARQYQKRFALKIERVVDKPSARTRAPIETLLAVLLGRIIRRVAEAKGSHITRAQHTTTWIFAALIAIAALVWLTFTEQSSAAQQRIEITGDRLSGVVLPIEPIAGNLTIQALHAHAWTVDDTKRLLLQGDIHITLGGYSFVAEQAVLWLNRLPSEAGLINQIAIYFEEVDDPTKQAGAGVRGERLLVTASTRGEVMLDVALLDQDRPRANLIEEAEARLAEHIRGLLAHPPALRNRPQTHAAEPEAAQDFIPLPGGRIDSEAIEGPQRITLPASRAREPWISPPDGVVRYSANLISVAPGADENVVTIVGPLVMEYLSNTPSDEWSQLTLSAERAVIFTEPGPLQQMTSEIGAAVVRGIYLEGNVSVLAENGAYSVRSPRMYYDFRTQQAIMLDSVLRTQPREGMIPVHARALEMRQIAANQWSADEVIVSTSEFRTPHLAIGARTMSITQQRAEGQPTRTFLESRGNTLQASGIPIFPWPRFSGEAESVPLRSIEVGSKKNDGLRMLTDWDLYTILGKKKPDGVDATLSLDGFTERGAGGGLEFEYDVGRSEGALDLYGLHDDGTDRTSSGRDVDPQHEWRGYALFEHQTRLDQQWTFQSQLAYISDETFMTAWREDWFTNSREFETSMYLKHQRENAALTLLGKYSLQDFISNDYLLASRQYAVDKAPELTYRRYGDSLFGDLFTYSTENRLTRMALAFQHSTPAEIGVREGAFGIDNDVRIDEALRAAGYRENWVSRVDSRHELALPIHAGALNVVPFVVGRVTGYDDDFEEFSSDADEARFFGAAGLRASMQFQKIDNAFESRMFDIHRLRHLVEPYIVLWHGESNVDQFDLPVYDEEVESIADGNAIQIGVRNTWQTQRGGAGQWRSVDVFALDTSAVFDSEGDPNESPTPQFFEFWPEYSRFGDHVRADANWLISDSLSLVGETIYALGPDVFARGSIGAELRHSPLLITYIEYRVIAVSNSELLGVGWTYQLTPKYRLVLQPQYDFREEDFRAINVRLTRSFPDFDFTLHVRYDQIRDDTSVGATLGLVEF